VVDLQGECVLLARLGRDSNRTHQFDEMKVPRAPGVEEVMGTPT
jgi:hypothetical protein